MKPGRARGVILGALLIVSGQGCALLNHNLRAVEPGVFYRAGQMPAGTLARTIDRHGIRTVINLRGEAPEEAWFQDEQAVCAAREVSHHSLAWSKNALPTPESLARFVSLCQDGARPILVHCQGGVHRSGAASAVYVLLQSGSMDEARGQLGLFFGGAPIGNLLDLYEGSERSFGEWATLVFPDVYRQLHGVPLE